MSSRSDPDGATGHIEVWRPDRAIAAGLEQVAQGELVEIDGSGPALVIALWRDRVELAPLSVVEPARHAKVRAIGPPVTPAGEDLIGRTIDGLGRPLDRGPTIARDHTAQIFGRQPA